MRTPTAKQFAYLLPLGSGGAGMSRRQRDVLPFLRHGWVTAEYQPQHRLFQFVRLTPAGYHALARAVERHGLPELPTRPREKEITPDA